MSNRVYPVRSARVADAFILASGLLSALGWGLALAHQLTFVPYVCGLVGVIALVAWLSRGDLRVSVRKPMRRMRKPIVAVYAMVWLASLIGGALYAPSNYDALSYRIPQLLHWIAEAGWHWIDAPNSRMNIAPPGMNWLIAPFYFLTKSDRLWYLVNIAAFSLLPGYLFELFRRAGASPRIAWWFMWLVPCGYAFALQAGSIGNDLLSATFVTASLAIGLRARSSGKALDVWLSAIAIAMATGVKSVNLPLLLPWVVAIWPAIPVVSRRPVATIAVLVIVAFGSCFPTTLLNFRQTGHWTGDPKDEHRVEQPSTFVGIVSNAVMLAVANTQPPVLPNPSLWNQRFESWLARTPFEAECRSAPRFEMRWGELPTEELAGAGPGFLLISGALPAMALIYRKRPRRSHRLVVWGPGLAGWIAFACFVAQFSSEAIGRLSAPFVPILLLPLLQLPSVSNAFRPGWMRVLAVTCSALSLPGLVFSPARPLFPVNVLISATGSGRLGRIAAVYATYGQRSNCYAPLLEKLHAAPVGELWFAGGGDDPEAPAWKPYGNWKVKQWTQLTLPPPMALASELGVRQRFDMSWEDFTQQVHPEILGEAALSIRAGRGTESWYILRMSQPPR